MSNLAQRLLLFFVALPLLLLSVIFVPQAHHGIIILILLVATTGSALELSSLLGHCGLEVSKPRAGAIGFLLPAAFYASTFLPGQALALMGLVLALVAIASFAPLCLFLQGRPLQGPGVHGSHKPPYHLPRPPRWHGRPRCGRLPEGHGGYPRLCGNGLWKR